MLNLSINLIRNYSFEEGLTGWQTGGDVDAITLGSAFERNTVAQMAGIVALEDGVISQLVRVPPGATHFHVVYAVRPTLVNVGNLIVQVEFRGSANLDPPLPLRRVDTIDVINDGALVNLDWQTRYAVTGEIPPLTEWARLRFVTTTALLGGIQIDAVFMTTD
mgnify:CR=1 FL=1